MVRGEGNGKGAGLLMSNSRKHSFDEGQRKKGSYGHFSFTADDTGNISANNTNIILH